ncbi:MAG: hypothetical protein VX776_03425, partial [Planctomycetota bacterium]|nr:hypothetical protein [Planctomycetota bacterium]
MVQIPERSPAETEVLAPASESSASADVTKQSQDHSDTVEDFGYTAGQDAGEEANQITNPDNSPPKDGENDEESSLQGSMAEWDDASATNKRKKLFISFSCISVLILISVILTFSFSGGDSLETADNPMLPPPPSGNAEQDEDIADPPAENPIDPVVTTENNDPEDMGDLT